MPTTHTYEVTVPVMVYITVSSEDGIVPVQAVIDEGWPGFFSEAQDAQGVWNNATDEWDEGADDAIADAAWQYVRTRLT